MVTSSTQARDPSSGRVKMWLGTIQSIFDHPIFGIGESQFRVLVPASGWAYNHPHNIVLQVALQWGLVGAACYFPIGAIILVHFQRTARRMGTAALPAYLTVMSLLVYSMYEGTLYHPYPIAMMLVGIAWVISSEPRANLTAENPALVPGAATLQSRAALTPAD
jgi:O-antigen ligase